MHFGAVQEFQGLNFTTNVSSKTNIAAIVGRNGAGKTRLLQAIAERKVEVFLNGAVLSDGEARLHKLGDLQPGLRFNFDLLLHSEQQLQAIAIYNNYKESFDIDPQRTISALRDQHLGHQVRGHVNLTQVAHAVSRASKALGKNAHELDDSDVGDYFSGADFMEMGSLNITGTVRAYVARQEQNKQNDFRNHKYGESNRYLTDDQFCSRFGPPPWILLNEVLKSVLGGRYQFEVPVLSNIAGYKGQLIRVEDGLIVEPAWLSSGEKVLMWLCLSMYATDAGCAVQPPKLLLLDEPDSTLHPQMVQKLHMVLKRIVDTFGCGILFTTHSPTSVALFDAGPIWQVSERSIVEVDKDVAIADLLVGLDQVSVHYTRCKQVYVESYKDECLYTELFAYLRRWNTGVSEHIALTFTPAAPKLAPENVRDILRAHLGDLDPEKSEAFIQALNGQGDCAQVIGAVESLNFDDGVPVHGIIDWDLINQPQGRIRVLGEGLFYSIESAIFNPLTLGIYLLQNFREQIRPSDYGLSDGFDIVSLYTDTTYWQSIADGVMCQTLGVAKVNHDLQCKFLSGGHVSVDRRYSHMNGHDLEARLRQSGVYPFLNAITKRPTLMMDVVNKVIQASRGRLMPMAFVELFSCIQASS